MNRLWALILFFSLSNFIYSQAPQKFTYQSIVRSADGSVLRSSDIGLQISILKNSAIGQSVYTETHSARSNANGLVTVVIGDGVSGDNISDIDWSTGQYYIKVEVDPSGGIGYSIEQTAQLLSVPYALYAGNSSSSTVDLDKDVEGVLPVSRGGTGSSTSPMIGVVTAPDASTARAILGIDDKKGSKVELKNVTDNYLSIQDKTDGSGNQELEAGTVPVTLGGTGSTTAPMVGVITAADAAAARAVLEIDKAGTDNSTAVTLATVTDNYLTLNGQEITAGTVPLTLGGTGATDAASARTNLGLGTIATQASDNVDIDGGAIDGTKIGENTQATGAFTSVNATTVSTEIVQSLGSKDIAIKTGSNPSSTIKITSGADGNISLIPEGTGQVIVGSLTIPSVDGTAGQVLKTDGSGNLGWVAVDASGTDNSTAVTLATVTDNYLTLNGQEITAGTVPLTLGGTGATDAASARTNLGLGTIATQASDAVDIDGGAIDGTKIGENTQATGAFTSVNATTVSASVFQSSGDTDVTLKTGNATSGSISIVDGADGNISISPNGAGQVEADNVNLKGTTKLAGTILTPTASELNIIDGDTPATSTTVVMGDRLILNDIDVGMKQVALPDVADYLKSIFDIDGLLDAKKDGTNFTGSMLIGHESVPNLSADAQYNLGIGGGTLDALTEGDGNIAIGNNSGTEITTGSNNIALGNNSLKATTTQQDNVAIGANALDVNTASYNVAVGSGAGGTNTSGGGSVFLGYNANGGGSGGSKVIAIGMSSAFGNTADEIIAIGDETMYTNSSGTKNIGIGKRAIMYNATGDGNTAVGWQSLIGASGNNHSNNSAFGNQAGSAIETGSDNVFVGKESGDTTTTGSNNVVVGSTADVSAAAASNQIVIGYGATGGGDNTVVIGNEDTVSLLPPGTSGEVDIGSSTKQLKDIYVDGVTYTDALGFGTTAMTLPTADGTNGQVLKTDGSGTLSWTANGGSGSGASEINDLTDALVEDNSVYIGNDPSSTTNAAGYNVAVGTTALDAITTGDYNTALGHDALSSNTTGSHNSASGWRALYSNITGQNNTAIGNEALYNNTQGSLNTAIGADALLWNKQGTLNTGVGYEVLSNNNNGDGNTALGYRAGHQIDGGDYNITIGYDADVSSSQAINSIVIGKSAVGQASNSVTLGNSDVTAVYMAHDSGATVYAGGLNLGGTAISSTAAELNLLDGGTSVGSSITVANDDGIIINDDGTMKTIPASDIKSYIQSATSLNDLTDAEISGHANSQLNSSIGIGTLMGSGSGPRNTALGIGAFSSQSGDGSWSQAINNTAIGYNALKSLTTGVQNTIVGAENSGSLTGSKNVVLGAQAGLNLSTADRNTIIGYRSVENLTTGDYNTIIGNEAAQSTADAQNQIVIGSTATGKGDNKAVIGNASVTDVYMAEDGDASVYSSGITRRSSSGTDTAGLDLTFKSGAGTGTGDGGSIVFQVADAAGSSGSSANSLSTAVTIQDNGNLVGSSGSISGFDSELNAVTSFSSNNYTLQSSDNGKVVTLDNGTTASTLSIPQSLGDGFNCIIVQKGNHETTIQVANGATLTLLNRSNEFKMAGRYAIVSVVNIGSETYILSGDTKN